MIKEVTYYQVICDLCGANAGEASDYSAWSNPGSAEEDAGFSDWHIEGGNHICSECQYAFPRLDDEEPDGAQ